MYHGTTRAASEKIRKTSLMPGCDNSGVKSARTERFLSALLKDCMDKGACQEARGYEFDAEVFIIYDYAIVYDLINGDLWLTSANAIVTRSHILSSAIVCIIDSRTRSVIWRPERHEEK